MTIDFTGTSPQLRGPFNCVPSGAYAGAYFAVLAMADSSVPINGGCFRPIELVLPEGTLVNPREPAPVNSRTSTIKRIAGTIIGALREARPENAPADAGGALHVLAFGGAREDGSRYVVGELIASGSGASDGKDGVDVIETDGSNCMNLPVEALEMDVPIRLHRSELRPDSGGPGAWRGGLGISREYEILSGEVVFTHRGERHRRPAPGRGGRRLRGLRALRHPAGERRGGGHPFEDPGAPEARGPGGGQHGGRGRLRRPGGPTGGPPHRRFRGRQGEREELARRGKGGCRGGGSRLGANEVSIAERPQPVAEVPAGLRRLEGPAVCRRPAAGPADGRT